MTKIYFACCFMVIAINSMAQSPAGSSFDLNKKFTVAQLREDLKTLKDSLEVIHPALYRYANKLRLDSAFNAAGKLIDKPLTQAQFYGIAAPIISMIGDIHTTIEPSDETFNYLATQTDLFPFDTRIINQKVYIASNNSADTTIPAGSRIMAINNESIDKLLTKMKRYFSDEGTNETLQLKRIEQRFAFQYYLTNGYARNFTLTYSTDNKPPVTKQVAAQPFSMIRQNRTRNQAKHPNLRSLFPQPPYLSLTINGQQHAAVMTIRWFQNDVLQGANESFKPFIDSAFNIIQTHRIDHLVIDIRNNGGGESGNASYLYAWLTQRPFRFLHAMEANEKTYMDDVKRSIKYQPATDTHKYQTADSTTQYQQLFGFNVQQPVKNNYTGRLYVLIDGLTTSAATQFAALVKQNKRGILIGETAPGSLYGGSGRGYSYFYLPHSGLLTMISQYRLYMTDPGKKVKDVVITPDHQPQRSIQDTLSGKDKDLEYAEKLIAATPGR